MFREPGEPVPVPADEIAHAVQVLMDAGGDDDRRDTPLQVLFGAIAIRAIARVRSGSAPCSVPSGRWNASLMLGKWRCPLGSACASGVRRHGTGAPDRQLARAAPCELLPLSLPAVERRAG